MPSHFGKRILRGLWASFFSCSLAFARPLPYTIKVDSDQRLVIIFSLPQPEIKEVSTEKGTALMLNFQGLHAMLRKGDPALPLLTGSIDLRRRNLVRIQSRPLDKWYTIKGLYAPSKGNIYRNENPQKITYQFGNIYEINDWYPKNQVIEFNTFNLGPHNGLRFAFSPVRVHPKKKLIQYALQWEVILEFAGNKEETVHNSHPSAAKLFLNNKAARYTPVPETGDLLVICAPVFREAMMPWVHWKNRRGIRTHVADLNQTGTTIQDIKTYIQTFAQQHPISHILLVGDFQHIPSPAKWGGVSDITYGELIGNDAYPELFVGRLSVESLSELETILSRWLRYEQNPDLSTPWLDHTTGIASNEGPGDDNQMDSEHSRALIDVLTSYTYTYRAELFDGSQGPPDAPGNPSATDFLEVLNSGSGLINYTGHGWEQGIATTGFSNAEADQVNNDGRAGLMVIVGCMTGAFHTGTSFSEKLTRIGTAANPHGITAVFGATINQSWSPPMEAQDAIVDILTENESNNVVMRTIGGLLFTGCMRMNDAYGVYGDEITETWILFGDPTMPYYTQTPAPLAAAHPLSVSANEDTILIQCPVEGALVCISQNNHILGRAHIVGGTAAVPLNAFNSLDSLDVVVSAFNYIPYQGRIGVLPPWGPFPVISQWLVSDALWGNNNAKPEFAETLHVEVQVTNLGLQTADSVFVDVICSSAHATVTGGPLFLGSLNPGDQANTGTALQIVLSAGVPDGTSIPFTILCTWNGGQSQSPGGLVAAAPLVEIVGASLTQTSGNANGISESGENLLATVWLRNAGTADLPQAEVSLTLNHPWVQHTTPPALDVFLPSGGMPVSVSFTLEAAPFAPVDAVGPVFLQVGNPYYHDQLPAALHLNPTYDDFETGPFWCLPYQFGSQNVWRLDDSYSYNGLWSLRSSPLPDNGISEFSLSVEAPTDDSLSFWFKLSSEQHYDFLKVFVDGILKHEWSGEIDWTRCTLPLSAGVHTVHWRYEKDYMIAAGQDAAWIDQVELPNKMGTVSLVTSPASELRIFPNPVSNVLFYLIEKGVTNGGPLHILTPQGNPVLSMPHTGKQGYLNVSLLATGLYFLQVEGFLPVPFIKL
ncbi:MAG: C25 family cysteine peptidase [Flavobacteriales bacterium]|nr:C25 family cysteine peptidase [Flavobacteriales bacterium]